MHLGTGRHTLSFLNILDQAPNIRACRGGDHVRGSSN